jgi:hypothetical protein
VKIPVTAGFSPYKVDQEGFTALLGKKSSRWGAGTAKLIFSPTTKSKSAFKAVSGLLHCHVVEVESTKAASFSSKSGNGSTILCLAKMSKDVSTNHYLCVYYTCMFVYIYTCIYICILNTIK